MVIHIGAGLVLYSGGKGLAVFASIIAFIFYIIDGVMRSLGGKLHFQRTLNIFGIILCILSVTLWILAAIHVYP